MLTNSEYMENLTTISIPPFQLIEAFSTIAGMMVLCKNNLSIKFQLNMVSR